MRLSIYLLTVRTCDSISIHGAYNNKSILLKDYNMLMRKYSKKYSGDKLKYFIKGKLYQKGYSLDKIGEVIDE